MSHEQNAIGGMVSLSESSVNAPRIMSVPAQEGLQTFIALNVEFQDPELTSVAQIRDHEDQWARMVDERPATDSRLAS